MKPSNFTVEELLFTYRKVKQELFYEKESIYIDRIIDFEMNLQSNIDLIFTALHDRYDDFFLETSSLGKFNFIFKNVTFKNEKPNRKFKFNVENLNRKNFEIDKLSFRYMADISIVFQIIGGLWINRIGYQIDKTFGDCVYGCRIKEENSKLKDVPYYKQNHSFYKPYFSDYKKWQNNLFKVIEDFKEKDIQVITADITKFYHSVHIETLKAKVDELISSKVIEMKDEDKYLHELLFKMIIKFNTNNNIKYKDFYKDSYINYQDFGLPLSLNVSRILSNVYLQKFDIDIIKNVKPLYYGRYVDDLILAVEHNQERDFDNLLSTLTDYVIKRENTGKTLESTKISIKSTIHNEENFSLDFNIDKLNIFYLNGNKDQMEINHLKRSINETSSEWKLIPTNDEYEDIKNIDLFYNINSECETLNSIRKSSNLILKRNKFLREIISFESYIYNSHDEVWKKRLVNFLNITKNYIFDFKNFVDLNKFIPRLFGLLIHTNDEELIKQYYLELEVLLNELEHDIEKSSNKKVLHTKRSFKIAKKFLEDKIIENIIYTSSLKSNNKFICSSYKLKESDIEAKVKNYFNCDFHIEPFKNTYFKYDEYEKYLNENLGDESNFIQIKSSFIKREVTNFIAENLYSKDCDNECKTCVDSCKKNFNSTGFYFFTRRASILELSVAFKNLIIKKNESFIELAKYYYHKIDSDLFKVLEDNSLKQDQKICRELSIATKTTNDISVVKIKGSDDSDNPVVCNSHFLTKDDSYDAKIRDFKDPDKTRKDRIFTIVNNVIRSKEKIDYLIFHELSLPRSLYLIIAQKLASNKINLIAGLDYKIDKSDENYPTCDNQMVYILNLDDEFSGSVALYQSKLIGAIAENELLFKASKLAIKPKFRDKLIIDHNNFVFSGLICNDMLDINNRSYLRGEIDNLFLVAWNKDLETYRHLVNSASLDLHSFITLTNNKIYGNSCIRGPYKNDYERDVQIIHGGELDNFMVSTLDIKALRKHQCNHIAPDKPFKPLPTGFKISKRRLLK